MSPPHPFLFDWLPGTPEEQRAHCLADVLVFVADTLSLVARSGMSQDYVLSSAAAAGLAHLLTGIEQSLRCDVSLPDKEARS
jgi:hypothetical protein